MSDIIEQLEKGKKLQEEQGIDADSLRTKIGSSEEEKVEKPKPKRGRKKKAKEVFEDKNNKEVQEEIKDPFEQAEQIMNGTKLEEEKPKKAYDLYPDFDFHDEYAIGQGIFYLRVHKKLGLKEILPLTIRTIYPRTLIAFQDKGVTYCIGVDTKDMVFTNKKIATKAYNSIKMKGIDSKTKIDIENEEDTNEFVG